MQKLSQKITNRSKITFKDFLLMIYKEVGEKKITNDDFKNIAKRLNITEATFKKYYQKAKDEGFITKRDTIAKRYIKKIDVDEKNKNNVDLKDIENSGNKSGKIFDISKGTLKKFVAPKGMNGKFDEIFGFVLKSMDTYGSSKRSKFILLAGDSGVGKTSFVKQFAKLLGLPLFVVKSSCSKKMRVYYENSRSQDVILIPCVLEVNNKKIKEDFVGTDLVNELKEAKNLKLEDINLIRLYRKDENLKELAKKYKNLIKDIRKEYDLILFLDEFFETDTMKLLEGIIRYRRIFEEIPGNVYIIIASNLHNKRDAIPSDYEFALIDFKNITKDEWFAYFKKKFIDNEEMMKRLNFKPEVFNTFYEALTDEDIIYEDKRSKVKISPRRWEQLLLFINSVLPINDKNKARILLENIKNNFRNYQTGEVSPLFRKILSILEKIIQQTSNIELNLNSWKIYNVYNDWKSLFKQQLEIKIKLDSNVESEEELIKFIPIINAPIPSLTIKRDLSEIAKEFDLEFIFEPFYNFEFLSEQQFNKVKEPTKVKGKGKYKYLLVIDEISDIEDRKFIFCLKDLLLNKNNALNDVLIVLAFDSYVGSPKLDISLQSIVNIGSVIEARPSWKDLERNLLNNINKEYIEKFGFDLEKAVFEVLKLISYRFRIFDFYGRVLTEDESMFFLKIGYNELYLPPERIYRFIESVSLSICNKLTLIGVNDTKFDHTEFNDALKELLNEAPREIDDEEILKRGLYDRRYIFNFDEKDKEKFYNAILEIIYEEFQAYLIPNTTYPLRMKEKNTLKIIKEFIFLIPEVKAQFKGLFEKVDYDDVKPLSKLIKTYENNIDTLIDSTAIFNYIECYSSYPTRVFKDFIGYVKEKIYNIKNEQNYKTNLYTNILKIEQSILEIFEDNILNEEEVYFLFEFANAIKVISNLIYENGLGSASEKEKQQQEKIVDYIVNFFKKLGLEIEKEEIFNRHQSAKLKIPLKKIKGFFIRDNTKVSDSFLYDEEHDEAIIKLQQNKRKEQ